MKLIVATVGIRQYHDNTTTRDYWAHEERRHHQWICQSTASEVDWSV